MSNIEINAFFKFSKVELAAQKVDIRFKTASIKTESDKRKHQYALAVITLMRFLLRGWIVSGRHCQLGNWKGFMAQQSWIPSIPNARVSC
jgi:hypothetical protein